MPLVVAISYWVSALGIAYTYVGYGILIALLARWRPRPVAKSADYTPSVTLLVAAYNEESCIRTKIENSLALDYPLDKLDILVVADGSNDGTMDIVQGYAAEHNVRLLHQPERQGKPAALIRALPHIDSQVIVFSDANSYFYPSTLRMLIRNLADPAVGGVGGVKRMSNEDESLTGQGEGLYWRYESFLKACDSAVSSVMGVPGEVWAAKREAYIPSDPDSYIEDFVASLRMVAAGWRVVYEPEAIAYEKASPGLYAEWGRRTRMAAGGWQSLRQLSGMLRTPHKLLTFQYLSHRMIRWIVTPTLFVLLLASNLLLASAHPFYAITLIAQGMFYSLAGLGWWLAARGRRIGWLLAPFYVCLLNAAALAGGWRHLRGRQSVVWRKVRD